MKLIIAEKKSQAEDIAKGMGWKSAGDHLAGQLDGEDVKLVWARGHLLMLEEPQEVKEDISWDDPNSLLPIPTGFKTKITPERGGATKYKPTKDYVATIRKHIKGATEVVIATDPDREGESIGWEILESLKFKGKVTRAWFASGLDSAAIKKAMSSLRDSSETKPGFRASEARGRSDWSYQFLVRGLTYYGRYGGMGSNLGRGYGREAVVSVGRVQTPTLRLIVDRDMEIENFKPTDHFVFGGDFDINSGNVSANFKPKYSQATIDAAPPGVQWEQSKVIPRDGQAAPLDSPLFTGREEVGGFKKRLLAAADQGIVKSFAKKDTKKSAPPLYDLAGIQGDLNRSMGMSSAAAQKVIEGLYQKGLISYPRTAHKQIPWSMYSPVERNPVLNHLQNIPELNTQSGIAKSIHDGKHPSIDTFKPGIFSSKPMEHHGLIPTHKSANLSTLSAPEKAAYLMIAKRYIQGFYPPAKIEVQELEINIPVKDILGNNESRFFANSERVVDYGWMDAFPYKRDKKSVLKAAKQGDKARLDDLKVAKKTTTPPARYNDQTLLKAMENVGRMVTDPKLREVLKDCKGIGTPATRSTVMETLKARGYIASEGKNIISKPKGRDLISALPDELTSVETTAVWETCLDAVSKSSSESESIKRRDDFVNGQVKFITDMLNKFKGNMQGKLQDKPVESQFGGQGRNGGKASSKMANAIKAIASAKGLKVPRGLTADYGKASAWLDEHGLKEGEKRPPSDKQMKFVSDLAEQSGSEIPQDVKEDHEVCKKFIDSQLKGGGPRKPTDRMLEVVNNIAEKNNIVPPEKVLSDYSECSKFLDQNIKSKGSSKKRYSGKKKSPAKKAGRGASSSYSS